MIYFLFACSPQDIDYDYQPETTDTANSEASCIPKEPGDYERIEQEYWFGALTFQMTPGKQTLLEPEQFYDLHMNTISLRFLLPFDYTGGSKYPYERPNLYYASLEDSICQMGNTIHDLKEAGFSIILSGEPHYYSYEEWIELHPDYDGDYHSIDILENEEMIDQFIIDMDESMKQMTDMAEKYHVEIVSPISEADRYFGAARSDEFQQNILPIISDYSGELLWQVYGEELREPDLLPNAHQIDFSGYDILGFSIIGCDGTRLEWDWYIDTLMEWGTEDNVPSIMVSELGCVREPNSIENAISNFDHWYEKTKPYSDGFIALDTPQGGNNAQGVANSWFEDWLKEIASDQGLDD